MRSLYLRIYLTVVVALALFALVSGWFVQRHLDAERTRIEASARERVEAWADLLQRSLPGAGARTEDLQAALQEWSQRLRLPMALDDAKGHRLATSETFARREAEAGPPLQRRLRSVRLDDGRTLWLLRPGQRALSGRNDAAPPKAPMAPPWLRPHGWPEGSGLAALLLVLFAAVALGAWPVVRRLTRRLEALKQGVEAFGAGALNRRVVEDGSDEVAALGASFNRAAARIEALLQSHKSLLANTSHELRSPLTRLKMAVSMLEDATPAQRAAMRHEIDVNIGELDVLVDEVLLASRLDATQALDRHDEIDLLGLAAEEAARVNAGVQGDAVLLRANERLVRRALRNLLENARRYGGGEVELEVRRAGVGAGAGAGIEARAGVEVAVCDRGPGVPEAYRERIFEPFFRLPGHAEKSGGVGLGLALVRQIAERHGGAVRCTPRDGGGSCFTLALPLGEPADAAHASGRA
ncbi:MAG: HAMP domain-containing protein [Rubrivivax sp.]|nr:HAMP domain-containing protein [Rubrivivax sp.]MBK8529077.1 HAMP domain-containing protein [Rubrivivax sp.]